MTRIQLVCTRCGIPLENDIHTFGDVGQELCEDCWYEFFDETYGLQYYGMAPHIHDLSLTGSFIGSTILLDYKATSKQDANGRYWIEERKMWFTPDEETDGGCGLWEER